MNETITPLSPGLPPVNSTTVTTNDVRRWIYDWFTMWEHRVPAQRLVRHLADESLSMTFPGGSPLRSATEFTDWYEGLLANTVWNFHELSNITVVTSSSAGAAQFDVGLDIRWQGETEASSEWPTNLPGHRFSFDLHQDWRVTSHDGDPLDNPFRIITLTARMN